MKLWTVQPLHPAETENKTIIWS